MSNNLLDDQVRILVVDDSQEFLDMLDGQLRHAGYSVTSTLSGQEALDILRQASQPGQKSIDLVVLDIMMPDLDGIEVLERIRSDESLLDIPVLMLTCLESVDDKVRAFNAGANDYLTKPSDSREVLVRVRSLLQQQETRQSLISANENLTALQKSGQALLGTLKLSDTLQLILEQLSQVIGFDSASVMLVQSNFLEIVAQQGFRSDDQLFSYDKLEKLEHVQKVLREQIPEIIPDTEKDERWYTLPDSEYIRCWLGVPLVVKGNAIGVLNIDKAQPNFYNESHADLAVAFANQAAVAIENTRLFQETKQKADELKAITDHLDRLVASSFDGIITINTEGIVTDFNAMAEEILGYEAVEVIGKPVSNLYADPDEPRRIGKLLWKDKGGKLIDYETNVKSKSGNKIPIRLSAIWLFDAGGNRIGSAGYISQNVYDLSETTKHRQLLLDAINAVAQAENLNDGLQSLAQKMVEACLSTFCLILLLSDDGQHLEAQVAYPAPRVNGLKWDLGIGKVCRPFDERESAAILGSNKPIFLRRGKKREGKILKHIEKMTGLQDALQSALVVPLITDEERFGVCILGEVRAWDRTPFTEIEIKIAESMAAQVSALIGKMRLHELTQQRMEELDALQRLALTINSSLERDAILNQACQAAVEFFKVDHCGLVLFDAPDFVLGEVVAEYPAEMQTIGTRIPLKGILLEEEIIQKKEPIDVYDIETEERLGEVRTILHGQFGIQSSLYAPIIVDGKVTGTFGIDSTKRKRDFTPDIENSKLFAAHVATAIEKARVFKRVKQDAELTKAMVDVSRTLTGTRDLKTQMETVWEFVSRKLSAPMFYVGIYDEFKDELEFIVAYDMYQPKSIPPISLVEKKNWGPSGYVVKTRKQLEWYTNEQLEAFVKKSGIEFRQLGTFGQSSLILPLEVKDHIVGIIAMQSNEPNAWDDTEIGVFHTLAQLVGVAIRNTQLYQEKITGQKRLKAAYEASKDITSTLNPDDTLKAIVRRIREVVGAFRASVILIDEEGNPRHLASDGYKQNLELATSIRPTGISMEVVQSGDARFFSDILVAKDEIHPKMIEQNVRAAACLPLLEKEGVNIGVLWVHYAEVHNFTESEKEALRLYSMQAAIAFENALHMNEVDQMRQLAEELTTSSSTKEVLELVLRKAKDVLQADSTSIWVYDNDRDRFLVDDSAQIGMPSKTWKKFKQHKPKKQGMTYDLMEKGWIGVPNIEKNEYPFLDDTTRNLLSDLGIRSFQGIALTAGKEMFGVLYVNYNSPRWFSKDEIEIACAFANHATMALKKIKLTEEINKAHSTACMVAEATVFGDLQGTLEAIVTGTQNVLNCDAITLYTYNQDLDIFDFPPTTTGVNHPDKVVELDYVEKDSVPYRIVALDKPHVTENALEDPLLKGEFTKRENIKSFVGVQLIANDRKIGVMCVNYRRYHHFTPEELANIELFAHQAAVAIWNAQLFHAEQQYAEALEAIQETSTAVNAVLSLDEMLPIITDKAAAIFNAQASSLMLWDVRDENLIIRAAFGLGKKYQEDQRITRNKADQIIKEEGLEPHIFNIHQEPIGKPELVENEGLITVLVAPLVTNNELIGVLNIYSKDATRQFTKKETELATVFANQAATAIHNAQLYAKTNKRAIALHALYEAGKVVTSSLELDEILYHIAEQAWKLTGQDGKIANFVNISLVEGQEARFVAVYPPKELPNILDVLGAGINLNDGEGQRIGVTGRAIKAGCPQLVGDVNQDPDYLESHSETRSELVVLIRHGEEVIGAINAEHSDLDAFTKDDQQGLESLAAQAAVAIRNARQHQELKHTKGLVGAQTALVWMGMANNAWRHSIEGHAVNIRNTMTLLQQDIEKIFFTERDRKRIAKRIQTVEELAIKIFNKPITPPLSSEDGVETIIINDLIQERVRQLWENDEYQIAEYHLTLDATKGVKVWVSPEWVRRALDLLIDNALEAMLGASARQIIITTQPVETQIEISIIDTGKGIPPDIQNKLFNERIKKIDGSDGLGIGLLMAQAIIQTYGGEIHVKDTGPSGTTMTISLPMSR